MQDYQKRSRRRLSSLRRIIRSQLADSLSVYPVESERTFFMSANFLFNDVERFFKSLGV